MKKYRLSFAYIIIIILAFFIVLCNVKGDSFNNYSKINSLESNSFSASDLLSLVLNEDLTSEEKEYLDNKYSDTYLSYDDKIDSKVINTSIDNNNLTIHASIYYYNTESGISVKWSPYAVIYNDNTLLFTYSEGIYEVVINDISSELDQIKIEYQCNLNISKDSINGIINDCYNDVDLYVTSMVYEKNHQEYLDKLDKYNQYLADLEKYNDDLDNYHKYLSDLAKYNDDLNKYNLYLQEYDLYLSELEVYNEYLKDVDKYNEDLKKYQDYLNDLDNYQKNYDAIIDDYNSYLELKAKADYQLSNVELINTPMTDLNRTIYSAVMGDTVTTVLSMKDDLTQLNVPEDAIDRAEAATIYLRSYFESYFALTDNQSKYAFYSSNYSKFKTNIEELLRCLDKLYRSGLVKEALDYKGTTEKYVILVSQLALVSNAIDNDYVYNYEAWNTKTKKGNLSFNNAKIIDENWTIDSRTYNQVLGKTYVSDTTVDAYPLTNGYPSEVTLPTKPEEVIEPVKPEVVKEPIKPSEVSNPGSEPEEVNEPVKPDEVIEPTDYVRPDYITKLLNVYNKTLNKRSEFDSDYVLTRYTVFNKQIRNQKEITIEFHDLNDNLLYKDTIDSGSYISYNGIVPTKEEDYKYQKYSFSCWAYSDGTILDMNNVVREGFVYPQFVGILREFKVTWLVEGIETVETYKYGDIPVFKGEAKKENDLTYYYKFKSFDKELVEVTSDVTYTATFDAFYLLSYDDSDLLGATITMDGNKVVIDASNSDNLTYDLTKVIENINNPYASITLNSKDFDLVIGSYEFNKMYNNGLNKISLVKNEDEYYLDLNGNSDEYLLNISIKYSDYDSVHTTVSYLDENEVINYVRCNNQNDKISFSINSRYRYIINNTYSIAKLNSNECNYSISELNSSSGKTINITVNSISNGCKIDKVYVLDSNNNYIDVNKDGDNYTFIMPKSDVSVGFICSYINYTVKFVSDGVTISLKTYHYGDYIEVVSDPIIISDDYVYTFVGWDSPIEYSVTQDMTYNAIFEVSENENEGITKKKSIIRTIKIIVYIILSLALVAGGALLIFNLLKKDKAVKN